MNYVLPKDNTAVVNFINIYPYTYSDTARPAVDSSMPADKVKRGKPLISENVISRKPPTWKTGKTDKESGMPIEKNIEVKIDNITVQSVPHIAIQKAEGEATVKGKQLQILDGSEYTLVQTEGDGAEILTFKDVEPRVISIYWQFAIYVTVTVAELMMSITLIEFCITQSPNHLKTVGSAIFTILVAIGNMLVIFVTAVSGHLDRQSQFLIYTVLCACALIIFSITAKSYKYVTTNDLNELDRMVGQEEEENRKFLTESR